MCTNMTNLVVHLLPPEYLCVNYDFSWHSDTWQVQGREEHKEQTQEKKSQWKQMFEIWLTQCFFLKENVTRGARRQVRLPVGPASAIVPFWMAKWQSLVASDHSLLNRCRDQKTPNIFAKLLLEGFEGSPGQGSLECCVLWSDPSVPGAGLLWGSRLSLWWYHVCCERILFSTHKRK